MRAPSGPFGIQSRGLPLALWAAAGRRGQFRCHRAIRTQKMGVKDSSSHKNLSVTYACQQMGKKASEERSFVVSPGEVLDGLISLGVWCGLAVCFGSVFPRVCSSVTGAVESHFRCRLEK